MDSTAKAVAAVVTTPSATSGVGGTATSASGIKLSPTDAAANNNNNNNNTTTVTTNGIKENNSNNIATSSSSATPLSAAAIPIVVTGGSGSAGTSAPTSSPTASSPLSAAASAAATPNSGEANKDNKSTPPRDAPPPTSITKGLNLSATPIVKKEKRQSSSRYNVTKNCELTPLSPLNETAILKW
ncbi:DEP domain-containing protein DDB_G0279099-like [Rhagoletis pomonella]|uniref:DEP domain-containing protein DDB_G0279099-like n=1 Tax=Rhagoletis pomonella TaxID=28610 RepID=UPI00177E5210|nr:DEP domain-containing protein DDB_G0279099-like [Rhagoletis pomonella]